MPPRSQPKIHHIHIRSHKLSIMITVPPSTPIAAIKDNAFSALVSDVNQVEDVPSITSKDDFEISRAVKNKGKVTGEYEVLDLSKQVREYNLAGWETLYLQFRDPSSGNLLPVTFTQPSVDDEDEEPSEMDYAMSSTSKGKKRKAHFEDD